MGECLSEKWLGIRGMVMKRTTCWLTAGLLVLFVADLAFAGTPIKTVKPDGTPNRAAWMAQCGYGVMTHYLVTPQGDTAQARTADLNRIVDDFDLDIS